MRQAVPAKSKMAKLCFGHAGFDDFPPDSADPFAGENFGQNQPGDPSLVSGDPTSIKVRIKQEFVSPPLAQQRTENKELFLKKGSKKCQKAPKKVLSPEEKEKRRKIGQVFRHFLQWRLKTELFKANLGESFKSLFKCCSHAIPAAVRKKDGTYAPTGSPGHVQIQAYEDKSRRTGLAWMQKCANAFFCFVCAPLIRYKRGEEIAQICSKMLSKGYKFFFVTRTAPHDEKTDPVAFLDAFNEAARIFGQGKAYTKFCEKFGIEYQIKALEATDDSPLAKVKSGIHFHHHVLVFYKSKEDLTENQTEELRNFFVKQWTKALQAVGLCPAGDLAYDENFKKWYSVDGNQKINDVLRVAIRIDFPRINKRIKRTYEEIVKYLVKGAGIEMTPGIFSKNPRMPDRINHFELIALALTKYPESLPRAFHIMKALKGRSWLQCSPNLKALCGVAEKTDDELIKGNKSVVLTDLNNDTLREIDKNKFQADLIQSINDEVKDLDFEFIEGVKTTIKEKDGEIERKEETCFALDYEVEEKLKEIIASKLDLAMRGLSPLSGQPREKDKPPPVDFDKNGAG